MTIQSDKRFLLVDDDPLNHMLSKMVLRRTFGIVQVDEFLKPVEALAFIETEFEKNPSDKIITLFLDINMPVLSGWGFLDKFNDFKVEIKNQFHIYMLSSSIDPFDINRAKKNPLIVDYIEKPISKEILTKIFG